jgi:hypothetical protein
MMKQREFSSPELHAGTFSPIAEKTGAREFENLIASQSEVLVSRIEVEDLREPEFLQALVYWHIKRGPKAMPARADLSPADIVKVLPKVVLIDVLPNSPHFRYRVCGTNIVDWIKFDATGQTLDTVKPEKYRQMLFATYMECVGARHPIAHRILWNSDDLPHRYKRLTMPLSSDGKNVDMLLVISITESFEEACTFWHGTHNATRY